MENKYYTPSIEEFHVGFEFEWKGLGLRETDTGEWEKTTLSKMSSVFSRAFEALLEGSFYRVKYLDKEDIESLGFLQSGLSEHVFIYKDKIDIRGDGNKATIGINFTDNYITLIFLVDGEKIFLPPGVNLFRGNIKNKSELKVLLKQIGIDV